MLNPFIPQSLVYRTAELDKVCTLLQQDSDFVVTGVPGIGRRTLIRTAARTEGCRCLEIDFLRCLNAGQFLRFLADGLTRTFAEPHELATLEQWSMTQPLTLDRTLSSQARLAWPATPGKEWHLFQGLLSLPQHLAESLNCQVVIVFHNFPHIRSWDRQGKWERYLRQEIQHQNRVSYALIATVAEPWMEASHLPIISLAPLSDAEVATWIADSMATSGLQLDPESQTLPLFLSYVQGHLKDAITLAHRLWLDCAALPPPKSSVIPAHQIQSSMLSLVQDMSVTFEALLLLLPPTQAKVLESLALDPTDSPQSNAYIKKHQLSRGGGLQGALNSLEQKGLIYGPRFGYRIALPFLNFWLKQRLR
ncbi:ATP-binding protein [Synechococcales cyanobacterium C]|uniref:ATP-binding protein n=1 Tax=Petrachloros mirabilis ULC683 TaxID=2781853 RepID=A0A8K2A9J0_9CYAN|nr:ATP-binding protein [Petrachloros mirabilis]NCJ08319.1 ATP-binding protein [Petrachloros mirabilis ULC683]